MNPEHGGARIPGLPQAGRSPLSCRLVRELLPEALGGELHEEAMKLLEDHARHCHACGAERVRLKEAREALALLKEGGAGSPSLPEDFFRSMRAEVLEEIDWRRKKREEDARIRDLHLTRKGGFRVLGAGLPGIGLLAATLLLGLFLGRGLGRPEAPKDSPAGGPAHAGGGRIVEKSVHLPQDTKDLLDSKGFRALASDPQFAEKLRKIWREFQDQTMASGDDLSAGGFDLPESEPEGPPSPILGNVLGRTDF